MIRKSKKTKEAEVVLLDHGLYQVLPDDERKNLCYLWKSIVLHDETKIKKYSSSTPSSMEREDPNVFDW